MFESSSTVSLNGNTQFSGNYAGVLGGKSIKARADASPKFVGRITNKLQKLLVSTVEEEVTTNAHCGKKEGFRRYLSRVGRKSIIS